MPYTVQAFDKFEEIIENFDSEKLSVSRFEELIKTHDAAYVYDPNGQMIRDYSDSYFGYEPQIETCVYCGSEFFDGYCYQSPDGKHCSAGLDG